MTDTYQVEIIHEDVRREVENYVNQAKALGITFGSGYSDFSAYVQLIGTIAQIEHNKQVKWRVKNDD